MKLLYIGNKDYKTGKVKSVIETLEGLFIEFNLKRGKWLLFGGYIPHKTNSKMFFDTLGKKLDSFTQHYDNILLLGDFNCEPHEKCITDFCQVYNIKNMIKEPTCFKNPMNPSCIDLIL